MDQLYLRLELYDYNLYDVALDIAKETLHQDGIIREPEFVEIYHFVWRICKELELDIIKPDNIKAEYVRRNPS